MKIGRCIQILVILLAILWIGGCKEITTTTIIHPDGTVTRIIEVEGDSSIAESVAYPIPVAEGWEKVHHAEKIDGETKQIWTMKKHFTKGMRMIDDMAAIAAEPRRIRLSTDLAKISRWFYTYYRYNEAVGSYNVFPVPVTHFLTNEELSVLTSEDSTLDESYVKEIEAKYERWQAHAMMEVLFQAVKTQATALEHSTLTAAEFEERKDNLYLEMRQAVNDSDVTLETFLASAAKTMKAPEIMTLRESMQPVWKDVEDRLAFMQAVEEDSYIFRVEMPGIIMESNGDGLEGNRVYWNVHHSQFLAEDYMMEATSRVPNPWAILITGVIGLAALAVLVIPIFRRR